MPVGHPLLALRCPPVRNGELLRCGGEVGIISTFERALDERRFGWFGCTQRGLHDNTEQATCRRCALRPTDDAPESTPFTDDRGDLVARWGQSENWVHTRWLDCFGRLHRDDQDQPALEANDMQMWAVRGRVSRPAGGPAILAGDDHWAFTNAAGYLHRDGGKPAISWDGAFVHVANGILTRPDGAAVYGNRGTEYWLDGRPTTKAKLWAHYLEPFGIVRDNAEAQRYLADVLERSDDPAEAFPDVDPLTVSVALKMHRNG